jgi:hypothetical protein
MFLLDHDKRWPMVGGLSCVLDGRRGRRGVFRPRTCEKQVRGRQPEPDLQSRFLGPVVKAARRQGGKAARRQGGKAARR